MPKRTNDFEALIALVERQLAASGVRVVESEMLADCLTGELRDETSAGAVVRTCRRQVGFRAQPKGQVAGGLVRNAAVIKQERRLT